MVDSLDGVDEEIHGLYEKGEKGYKLKVDGVEDVGGLKSALEKERLANKDAKTQLSELQKRRDEADKKTLEEQGKYKDLSERERNEKIEAQKKYTDLEKEIADSRRDVMVRDLALNMTTDKDEIDIISRFATDYVDIEGKEASFNKPIDELKAELSRFVRSKANDTNDKGNNSGGGEKDPRKMSEAERVKLFNDNPAEFNRIFKGK